MRNICIINLSLIGCVARRRVMRHTPDPCKDDGQAHTLTRSVGTYWQRHPDANKTMSKMMSEMGPGCDIRRETNQHRYNSCRSEIIEGFERVVTCDFMDDGPWQKIGADISELRCSFS